MACIYRRGNRFWISYYVGAKQTDPDAWDSDGVLTPHVIEIGDACTMIYAGKKANECQPASPKPPSHRWGLAPQLHSLAY